MPEGTVIDHPKAYMLVRMGSAEPADSECEVAAGVSPERRRELQRKYRMADRGIHPEDYEAFESGQMKGYNHDGSWIPGSNYVEPELDPVDVAKLELLEQMLGD